MEDEDQEVGGGMVTVKKTKKISIMGKRRKNIEKKNIKSHL